MEMINVKVDEINGVLVTTSNRVAEELGVNHKHLLEKIDDYVDKFKRAETSAFINDFYIPSSYKVNSNRRSYRNYLITKKGIAQLIGGYSSAVERAFELNVAYINKFDEMEKMIYSGKQLPINYGIDLVERKRDYCVIPFEQRLENTKEMVKLLTREIDDEINKIERSLLLLKDHKAHIKLYMLQI